MKLETVEQRHKFIDDMVKKAFAFEESLIHDPEHGDDWAGAMSTVENLVTIEEFIRTEQIFLDTFGAMEEIRTHDDSGKEIALNIVNDSLLEFIDTILLRRVEFAHDRLDDWDFVTEGGVKFKKSFCRKLNTLIKTYQDIYDL